MIKMIPPVPTSAVMLPTPKQKIGFSIESIVGHDKAATHNTLNNAKTILTTASPASPSDANAVGKNNNNNNSNNNNHHIRNHSNGPSSPPQTPPAGLVGSTHLPTSPQLPPLPPMQHHQHMLLPHHAAHMQTAHPTLTAVQQHALQQHALQQHIIMQQAAAVAAAAAPANMQCNSSDAADTNAHSTDLQNIIKRLQNSPTTKTMPLARASLSPERDANTISPLKRPHSPVPFAEQIIENPPRHHLPPHTPPKSVSPQSSHPSVSPALQTSACHSPSTPQHTPTHFAKTHVLPMMLPGAGGMPTNSLMRPFPVAPPPAPPQQNMPDIKALPPYINTPPELPPHHNPHLLAAAQFQIALQGHVLGPAGAAAAAAAAAGLPPHAASFMAGPGMPRDSYPLYPWLLSRHGRIFPPRYPGNFLLQPFRKPKRIRTAFSPSQLLKLEHAFESNQYVVGAERKALAQTLNLSETQVKVWFQNRRTKHKRMQQDDEKGGSCSERNSQNASGEEDDDELIDMEMYDECPSDDEQEHDISH